MGRWTVIDNYVFGPGGEVHCMSGDGTEADDNALAHRVAAALNAERPDPATTEPTTDDR